MAETNTHKTILITGASSGIGKAVALRLAHADIRLILAAIEPDDLNNLASDCRKCGAEVLEVACDLAQHSGVNKLAEACNGFTKTLDVLFLNAGVSQRAEAENTKPDVLRSIMEINFFSAVQLTQALLPAVKRTYGQIWVTTSISGRFGFPLRSAYSASKHALYGYFESLRLEQKNIKVCMICPGRVKTNISRYSLQADGTVYGKMDPGQESGITPDKAAKKIVRLVKHPKRELLIGGKEILMVYFKRYIPFVFYAIAKRIKPL